MDVLYLSIWNSGIMALLRLRFGRNLVASEKNPCVSPAQIDPCLIPRSLAEASPKAELIFPSGTLSLKCLCVLILHLRLKPHQVLGILEWSIIRRWYWADRLIVLCQETQEWLGFHSVQLFLLITKSQIWKYTQKGHTKAKEYFIIGQPWPQTLLKLLEALTTWTASFSLVGSY